jgi:FAD synthetase
MAERKPKMIKKGTIVLASGTFDLLHLGHVKYLEEAKKTGGKNAKLIVIVATDSTVEKRKGRHPVMPEEHRRALVESLKVVDKAILGYEAFDMSKVIDEIKPDIIAVGYDQEKIEEKVRKTVAEKGFDIQIVKIQKFGKTELNSSLKIKKKVTELYKG